MPIISTTGPQGTTQEAIKVPLQAEPQVAKVEAEVMLDAIHAGVRAGTEPTLCVPLAYIDHELRTTSDLAVATIRADMAWAKSRTKASLLLLYVDLKSASKVKVAAMTISPLMQSLELSKRARRLDAQASLSPITADDLMTPHALLKAVNPPWHETMMDTLADKGHRIVWGFYGGILVLCLQLAFGSHGG